MFHSIMGLSAIALMLYLCFLMLRYPHLWRMAWRNMLAQKHTSLLTALGLTISTALISMTLFMNASMNHSMHQYIGQHFGIIAHDLPSKEQPLLETSFFDGRDIRKVEEGIADNSVQQSGGLLPIVAYVSTIIKKNENGENLLIAPRLYTMGVDRNEAVRFDPSLATRFEEDLLTDEAILSESAAEQLEARKGDIVYILDESNREQSFKVKKVVQEQGLTGYQGIQGARATVIVHLNTARRLIGIDGEMYTNILLTEKISSEWKAEPVRATAEKHQKDASLFITVIFGMTSINAVMIGIVLITNIFKLIAEERRQEMGILRAVGLGKNDLKRLLKMEGLLYGAFSGLIGIAFGCGLALFLIRMLGDLITSAFSASTNIFRFYAGPAALTSGFSIGLLIVFLCVWIIAGKTVKISIIEALQVQVHPKRASKMRSLKLMWSSVLAGIIAVSFFTATAVPDLRRELITEDRMPFVFIAVLLSAPLLVFIFIQWLHYVCEGILFLFRKFAGLSLVMRLAFRNMNANRLRTGLILLMFAAISCFISFPVIYNYAIGEMMKRADPKAAIGGYDLIARDSRNIETGQLERQMQTLAVIQDHSRYKMAAVNQLLWKEETGQWGLFYFKVNGIDRNFADSNDIALVHRDGRFSDDREVWRELANNEETVILAEDTLKYTDGRSYDIGDFFPIQIGDKTVSKQIIGIAEEKGYHPESFGIWTNRNVIAALAKDETEIHTTLFIKMLGQPDKSLEKGLEKSLTLLNIYPIDNIVESENGWYLMGIFIFRLFQSFNIFALAIGMIGLTVVMYRLIRQRRHQIGMLRAVGVLPKTVFWSVLMEGAFIGLFGISLGYLLGAYMSYIVFDTLMFKDVGQSMTMPYRDLILYFLAIMFMTFLFSGFPARKVLRISPIEATRYVG
jgi:putative ABC transport system permease protein